MKVTKNNNIKFSYNERQILTSEVMKTSSRFRLYMIRNLLDRNDLQPRRFCNKIKSNCTNRLIQFERGLSPFRQGKIPKSKYSCVDICSYVLSYCNSKNLKINNFTLCKILYYIQGYFMSILEMLAFDDEIVIWSYGPTVPEAYYAFYTFGSKPIEITKCNPIERSLLLRHLENATKRILPEHQALIEEIVNSVCFDFYSPNELMDKTKKECSIACNSSRGSTLNLARMWVYFNTFDPLGLAAVKRISDRNEKANPVDSMLKDFSLNSTYAI